MNAAADGLLLSLRGLAKSYPGVKALEEVDFDIIAGETHALVGENGAGKSTLIKILAGAVQPDAGRMELNGRPYKPENPKAALQARVSTIYQTLSLMPDRSIMHNVMLGKEPEKANRLLDLDAMRQQTEEILSELRASHLNPEQMVGELKVGEKQIVEIAKALLNETQLLIMDEPTAALNRNEVEALFASIHRLQQRGITILYVSHRLSEIFELADRVTTLRDGRHISTRSIDQVTRESLIEDMIGRALSGVFPERASPSEEVVLEVQGLSSGKVLKDVSFSLRRGEVLAVAGLSGSGKTELGQALFGAIPSDRGRILLRGRELTPRPPSAVAERVIFLPEEPKNDGLFQGLGVKRNIAMSVLNRVQGQFGLLSNQREQAIADKQIEALDIKAADLNQPVLHLSGGNQQKVALGRCLAVDPDVFILMEPTQGIDVGVKFEFYQFIASESAQGRAILLVSSELEEILNLAHRILVMQEGRVAAVLQAKDTDQAEILRYALGESNSVA